MLWLKAWLETRWRLVFMALMGALLLALPIGTLGLRSAHPQQLSYLLMRLSGFLSLLAPIMLAGTGIETVSTRPGAADKGTPGSAQFTLSLPVTRTRLFTVRTVTGVLETVALLALFFIATWFLAPVFVVTAQDALGYFAVIVSCSLALYAISACLSTFCDEGWRFRGSGLAVVVLFMLSTGRRLPASVDIFKAFSGASPLLTHQVPWAVIATACVLALLFIATSLMIIRKRDY